MGSVVITNMIKTTTNTHTKYKKRTYSPWRTLRKMRIYEIYRKNEQIATRVYLMTSFKSKKELKQKEILYQCGQGVALCPALCCNLFSRRRKSHFKTLNSYTTHILSLSHKKLTRNYFCVTSQLRERDTNTIGG